MQTCDRCGAETISTTMSYFNTDIICPACDDAERAHPRFAEAREVELKHVQTGDFNFRGIGLPDDLKS